jgi:hypothetical protein
MVPEIVQEGSAVLNVAFYGLTKGRIDRGEMRTSNGINDRREACCHDTYGSAGSQSCARSRLSAATRGLLDRESG